MAKLDHFIIDDTTYEIVPEIAPLFNESNSYSVGDCVIKDAVLYRFASNHTGAWTGTDAVEVTVSKELTDLKADLLNISDVTEFVWIEGTYINTGGSVGSVVNINTPILLEWYEYAILDCKQGDIVDVTGTAGTAPRLWCFVDSSNRIISKSDEGITEKNLKIEAPANSAKVILNRNKSDDALCYLINNPKMTAKEAESYADYYALKKVNFNENVLDTSTCVDGGYYDAWGKWTVSSTLYSTDFIPCAAGDKFSINYAQDVTFYDIDKKFITAVRTTAQTTRPGFTVPEATPPVCYFRAYGIIDQKFSDGVYRGSAYIGSAASMPYGEKYNYNDKTGGKIIHAFGDSRTWYDLNQYVDATQDAGDVCIGYISWMRKLLSAPVYNHGVSGYTTPQILNVIKNTNFSNADIITLAGGINDFLHSVAIGSIEAIGGTFDTDTVYGALQSAVEYILTTKPTVKLMLINPFTGWINNDANEFSEAYADIKRKVAALYKLPLLDLSKFCGFNSLNREAFYTDDMTKVSYRLHLNDLGNQVIGKMVASFVSNGY